MKIAQKMNLDFISIYANKFVIINIFLHGFTEKFQRNVTINITNISCLVIFRFTLSFTR